MPIILNKLSLFFAILNNFDFVGGLHKKYPWTWEGNPSPTPIKQRNVGYTQILNTGHGAMIPYIRYFMWFWHWVNSIESKFY